MGAGHRVAGGDLPGMGLSAGDRPTADVEVLAGAFAVVEYELARRMHAATAAGACRWWVRGRSWPPGGGPSPHARRLARAGALAAEHPSLAGGVGGGDHHLDHVDAIARNVGPLTPTRSPRWSRSWHPVGAAVPGGGGPVRGSG